MWHRRCSCVTRVRRLGGSPDASASNPSHERRMGARYTTTGTMPIAVRVATPAITVETPRASRGGLAPNEGRGWREREIVSAVRGGKTRRRQSPGGARSGWNPKQVPLATALAAGSKALKSRARRAGAGHTAGFSRPTPGGHERAGETRYGSARGTIPWRANPGRGCGVEQTREAGGGANRRGRAKRRGRNVARVGYPAHWWTPLAGAAMRERNPKGGASRSARRKVVGPEAGRRP
jgi:hypothetical protein